MSLGEIIQRHLDRKAKLPPLGDQVCSKTSYGFVLSKRGNPLLGRRKNWKGGRKSA